jgi:methyltransferase (TIGR00027 family)
VLGAGLDTRAYRIARHSDMPVFEVDLPVNIDRKAAVLRRAMGSPPASVHLVPVDFEHDELMPVLESHGYRSGQPTFFIWEGVTQYLTAESVRATLAQLALAAPGSRLVFTYVRQDFIDGTHRYGAERVYRRFRQRRQVWKSGLVPEDVGRVLAEYGWRLVEQAGPSYFRDLYIRRTGRAVTASPIEWTALAER